MASLDALTSAPQATDVSKMTKVQKLAALLIILGPESAAKILRTLEARDLEQVSSEMARLPLITQDMRHEIMKEMSEVALTVSTSVCGGVEFTQTALEKAVGANKASDILTRVSPEKPHSGAEQKLADINVQNLASVLKDEHPQTIALVASYLKAGSSSELLNLLKPALRDQVVERLATMGPTTIEVLDIVVNTIQNQLRGRTSRALNQSGGIKSAAEMLNALNKNVSKNILTTLEERNAELGQAIRHKMFTFTDLPRLDTQSLQKLLREVDMRDLALALKRADDSLKKLVLSCMSKRAAETVTEEMSFMSAVKLKEIESAQMKIVETVRRLEEEGEIDMEGMNEAAPAAAAV
jgi:flagellar motor switch protein FliG